MMTAPDLKDREEGVALAKQMTEIADGHTNGAIFYATSYLLSCIFTENASSLEDAEAGALEFVNTWPNHAVHWDWEHHGGAPSGRSH